MAWHFRFVAHSEIGLVRKNNQDSGYAATDLLVVADGMGGAAAGDLASAAAIDRIRHDHETGYAAYSDTALQAAVPEPPAPDTPDEPADLPEASDDSSTTESDDPNPWVSKESDVEDGPAQERLDEVAAAIRSANDRLADLIADDHTLDGMGTTISAVRLAQNQYAIAHIGDSRAYLVRDGQMQRLTHDHSWVQSLVDEGRLTEDEANYHPHRSLLLKVLNGHPQHDPDLGIQPAKLGDRLLVCSDGLCGFVPDEVIAERLALSDPDEALAALIRDAHVAGGSDNITIIIADVVADEPEPEPVTLGAALTRDIPQVTPRPKVDLGDGGASVAPRTDAEGNLLPTAPSPKNPPSEEERYAPRPTPPWHRRWGRALLIALLAIVLVGGAGAGTYAYARSQYFVAPHREQVAIYRGLNEQIGDWRLHRLHEAFDIDIADLPRNFRDQLAGGITADDLDGARATVDELRSAAEACRSVRAERTRSPSPTPTPTTESPSVPADTASPSPPETPASPTPTTEPPAPTTAPTPIDEDDC